MGAALALNLSQHSGLTVSQAFAQSAPERLFFASGLGLIGVCAALAYISPAFVYGSGINDHPVGLFIALYSGAALVTFPLIWLIPRIQDTRQLLFIAIGIGLAARLLFATSTPIYEDDFYRYLWDGAVTAQGIDPFKYPPSDFQSEEDALTALLGPQSASKDQDWQVLKTLAADSEPVITRINYPYIKTEYPLVAQGAFALSYVIQPWSLVVWRLICLACELLALHFLLKALVVVGKSPLWSVLYWWNPIAIVELANRVHMEALLVPALAATIFFVLSHRPIFASAALSIAVGIKFWPALLFPVLMRSQLHNPKKLVGLVATAVILCAAFLAPQIPNGLDPNSGLITYSQSWQTNSFAFSQLERLFNTLGAADADLIVRLLVFLSVSGCALVVAIPRPNHPQDIMSRMLLATAALFFLSPTQYPWYFLWLLPFLVFLPVWPLLAMSVTLPLYFLRYYYADIQQTDFFENVIVPLEFAPIFVLLLYWLWRQRAGQTDKAHVW